MSVDLTGVCENKSNQSTGCSAMLMFQNSSDHLYKLYQNDW